MKKITFSIPWPLTADETRDVLSFAFQVSFVSYLGFFLIESLGAGFVSRFYTVDLFMWAAVITGLLSAIWPTIVVKHKLTVARPGWLDYLWMGVLAVSASVIVWYKISTVGWLAIVIAPLSGLIVLGLSLLVHYDRDDAKPTK